MTSKMEKRKGISPMVSLAVLLALTVAIGGILTGFFITTGEERTGEVGEDARQDVKCGNAGIQVTDALFQHDGEGNFTTVTISNTGTVNLPSGVIVSAFEGGRFINETDVLSSLRVEEERSVTFLTNVTSITEVQARAVDCPSKTSTSTTVENQTYVATPETGVS